MCRLTGDFALRVGARVVAALLQALTLVLIARGLGPAGFGIFGQAQSVGIVGAAIFSFGLSARALRLSVDENPRRVVTSMFIVRVLTAALVVTLVLGIFSYFDPSSSGVLLAVAALLFADMINDLTQGVLSGLQLQATAALLIIVHRLLPCLCVWLLPLPQLGNIGNYGAGCLLVAMIALIYPVWTWSKPANIRNLLTNARGFWLSTAAGPLSQLDTSIIRLTSSLSTVGYYAAASRVGAPINLVASSLVSIVVPAMTKELDHSRQKHMFTRLRLAGVVLASITLAISPILSEIIVRLLGEEYRPGWWIFCGVIVAAALSGINQTYQAYFFAVNKPRTAALSIGLGTIVGLIALASGSILWGIVGLAIGPVALQLSILLFFVVLYVRNDKTE